MAGPFHNAGQKAGSFIVGKLQALIVYEFEQSLAQLQNLKEACSVCSRVTQPNHCPSEEQIRAGQDCFWHAVHLSQKHVHCPYVLLKVLGEHQIPAKKHTTWYPS
jgi:hypothetical protein